MFQKAHTAGYKQVLPGIRLKTLVYSKKTLFAEFGMEANSTLPRHAHVHEQTGYLITARATHRRTGV